MSNIIVPGLCNFRLCTLKDEELMLGVSQHLKEIYETGKVPSRNIPARPNEDFDLLLGELLIRFKEKVIDHGNS